MSQLLFVWLGSNRAKKQGVSAPGVLLDQAARASLPVPTGAILLDDLYRLALAEEIAVIQAGRVSVPDPVRLHDLLYQAVRFPRIQTPVIARPLLSPENQTAAKHISSYNPDSFVDFADPVQLASSLAGAWSLAAGQAGRGRFDVLVLARVAAAVTGVACCRQADQEDQIYYSREATLAIAPGVAEVLSLPRPRWWWQSTAGIPPFVQRLQKLLRGLRRTFGRGDWHVEWIDDGHVCWLWRIQSL